MNPNLLTRELRDLPENIHSSRLPGGSLVSAVLDRKLMGWSDRGGASRVFGEVWSEFSWRLLRTGSPQLPEEFRVPSGGFVLRLDENPRVAKQAGRNKLANPDFLLIAPTLDGALRIRAVDAKFAIDRVRRSQISPEAIRALIEIPGSLVREEVMTRTGQDPADTAEYEPGAFLAPNTILNHYYYKAHAAGESPEVPASELVLVDVGEPDLFGTLPERDLMSLFRSKDNLPVIAPGRDILAGMYYLRLAYAARWFEEQSRQPLLSLQQQDPVSASEVLGTAIERAEESESAYETILRWSRVAEAAGKRQDRVQDAARLPIPMAELRRMIEEAGLSDDKKNVRVVRGTLERRFMRRLVEDIGEIPAKPSESMSRVISQVRSASRELKPEMRYQAEIIMRELSVSQGDPETLDEQGTHHAHGARARA